MSFLDRIAACNRHDLREYRPFELAGRRIGWLRSAMADALRGRPDLFEVSDARVRFRPADAAPAERSRLLAEVLPDLVEAGLVPRLRGEQYGIRNSWGDPELFRLDRGAVIPFGLRSYGVHVNGFVRRPDGPHLWIGLRAADKAVAPGKLDNMIAGGQPAGLSLVDNLVKEAGEEAGVPKELALQAVPVGMISYTAEDAAEGLRPDVMFCYDLELSPDFEPRPVDGEVERFLLMPADEVAEIVRETERFKFNCNLVVLDFLVRHGVIDPDREPDYAAICAGLRHPLDVLD